jgi:FAD:protein FMN transferase
MWTFRAMDTDVSVSAPSLDAAAEQRLARAIAAVFGDAEQTFSRFLDDSELARLNRARGSVAVSRDLAEALIAARRHVDATAGLFDPAIGAALEAAGYDRTFAELPADRAAAALPPAARFADLSIDEAARVVVRPEALRIDLGGLVKGRTVDRAATLLPDLAVVSAGGDAVLRGAGPDGTGWEVEIEDPRDPDRVAMVVLVRDRAVATTAPNRRRWRAGGRVAHHLIDPRTMRPAVSDLAQATVVAATAEDADVLAKVAFLLGRAAAARLLLEARAAGVLISADGAAHVVGDVEVVGA